LSSFSGREDNEIVVSDWWLMMRNIDLNQKDIQHHQKLFIYEEKRINSTKV